MILMFHDEHKILASKFLDWRHFDTFLIYYVHSNFNTLYMNVTNEYLYKIDRNNYQEYGLKWGYHSPYLIFTLFMLNSYLIRRLFQTATRRTDGCHWR